MIEYLEPRRLLAVISAGSLDANFGDHAGVELPGRIDSVVDRIAAQSDGKIVVASHTGTDANFGESLVLQRFNANGTLDKSFGLNGILATNPTSFESEQIEAIAVDSRNRTVIAGAEINPDGIPDGMFIQRTLPDGSLDSTFANGGSLVSHALAFGDNLSIAIDAHNRILLAGVNAIGDDLSRPLLSRFLDDGEFDAGFGAGGIVSISDSTWRVIGIKRENDGTITALCDTGNNSLGLINLRDDGSAGTAPRTLALPGAGSTMNSVNQIAMLPDGRTAVLIVHWPASGGQRYTLGLLNSSDRFDTKFGEAGTIAVSWGSDQMPSPRLRVLPDGKIAVDLGTDDSGDQSKHGVLLIDVAKNSASLKSISSNTEVNDIAITPDGNEVIACTQSNPNYLSISEINPETGASNAKFGVGGVSGQQPHPLNGSFNVVVTQKDGKILAAGGDNNLIANLARFNPDGSLDTTFGNGKGYVQVSGCGNIKNLIVQHNGLIIATTQYVMMTFDANGMFHTTIGRRNWLVSESGANDLVEASDGQLFGVLGAEVFKIPLGAGHRTGVDLPLTALNSKLKDLSLQSIDLMSNGNLLVGGFGAPIASDGSVDKVWPIVVEMTTDGRLVKSFDRDGVAVITNSGSTPAALLHTFNNSDPAAVTQVISRPTGEILALLGGNNSPGEIVQLTASGSADSSFGFAGVLSVAGTPKSLMLQRDGGLLVAGSFTNPKQTEGFVVRYTNTGALDSTFAINETALATHFDAMTSSLDGSVIAVGASTSASSPAIEKIFASDVILDPRP